MTTYFCWVDFTLFSQCFYYPYFRRRATSSPSLLSSDHAAPRDVRSHKHSEHTNYRALSNAAAHVAVAAARAAEEEEEEEESAQAMHERGSSSALRKSQRHSMDEPLTLTIAQEEPEPRWRGASKEAREEHDEEEEDEVDEDALAALADSFHSDGGRTVQRKRLS